jgi:hypothetical protein
MMMYLYPLKTSPEFTLVISDVFHVAVVIVVAVQFLVARMLIPAAYMYVFQSHSIQSDAVVKNGVLTVFRANVGNASLINLVCVYKVIYPHFEFLKFEFL